MTEVAGARELRQGTVARAYRIMKTIRGLRGEAAHRIRHGRDPGLRAPLRRRGGHQAGLWPTSTRTTTWPAHIAVTATPSPRAATSRDDAGDLRQGRRHLSGQGRLHAHRRPRQGHARRERHRRRRPALGLRRRALGQDARHNQVGVSFTGDGGANQGTFLESLTWRARGTCRASSSSRTTATRRLRRRRSPARA